MTPRERNLYLTYQGLGAVTRSLRHLSERMQISWTIDRLNDEILQCFYAHGHTSRGRVHSPAHEPWMTFLSDNELEVRIFSLKYDGR